MNPPQADRGYGRPSGRPRVSHPATYRSGTPQLRFRIAVFGFVTTVDGTELNSSDFAIVIWFSRAFQQILDPHSAIRNR